MITGDYRNTLDEKGRLLIPSRIRTELPGSCLVLTQGIEQCIWMFPPENWKRLSDSIMASTSPFNAQARLIQRRIIAPAQEVEIDKAGRITIPPSLREYSRLTKDTVILGIAQYLEIWDADEYRTYLDDKEAEFKSAAEGLGELLPFS
ncbi:division/cell wall cluster transcriptional repressor MraZ [Spirochaeta africana]|uniref:Transcriptional regulator MraZ n=1 Tax=Spirochaeta africana (strain ATCC 700263 / DSM 8902 / Z-7692) TaxID=889378 RepID=H9UKX9_SPIAZ|nr:division/cell wall cluster transcriptional repressor MraZ [Spirochaeta africana]AFG38172.1 mraZ protein [Spirochaeta africana DSM 8902]